MIKTITSKFLGFFLLLLLTTSCSSTGSPWGSSSGPAKNPPSRLAEVELSVADAGTVYDPYDYYMRKQMEMDGRPVVEPIQDGSDMTQPGPYSDTQSSQYKQNLENGAYQQQSQQQMRQNQNPSMEANNGQPPMQGQQSSEFLQDTPPIPQNVTPARKVKVALLLPLSGQHKLIGQEMLNAAQMALFEVGDQGFELLPKDTKGTIDGAVRAATQAAQSGAELVLGPLFADNVRAIRPILSSYGMQAISFSTDWTVANSNTFVMGILPHAQVTRITDYISDQGYQNYAFIAPTNEYGQLVHRVYERALRRNGRRLYPENTLFYSPLESDFSHRIREFVNYDVRHADYLEEYEEVETALKSYPNNRDLKKRKAELDQTNTVGDLPFEVLMVPVGGEDAKTIVNLLRYYDIDQKNSVLIGTGLWDDAGLISEQAFNGTLFASPSPQARGVFEKNYDALYGKKPARIASLAYDATALASIIAAQAYHAGYPNERVYSRNALMNANGFAGVDGIFRFGSNGIVERGLAVLEIQDGNLVVRDPAPITFQR